ncbi:hypothetical protein GJ744_011750 [Endocarpon pusillum]|uniref:Uncharacterized protein n=1 Tax=Endocarpon pusillum TaxID=364733 RepID=A0A8H7E4I9_9EURO|nr:hypothetical protein GJ744_011750 [Endocarpon pusillum]
MTTEKTTETADTSIETAEISIVFTEKTETADTSIVSTEKIKTADTSIVTTEKMTETADTLE